MTRDEAKKLVRDWDRYAGHEANIRAYADGAEIQWLARAGWVDMPDPNFDKSYPTKYRVKPKAIEVTGYVCIREHLGYAVGHVLGDGMVPLAHTNWKAFSTTVEV